MLLKKTFWCSLVGIIFVIFIILSPTIDKSIAIIPFEVKNKVFYGEINPTCKFIYQLVGWLTLAITVGAIIGLFIKHKSINKKKIRYIAAIVLISLSLGPGLVVNSLFKNHWGRARPYQVLRDGQNYSPVWEPHLNRGDDNSFPSGHAAIGFFLGVPLLVVGYRRLGILVSISGGFVVGMVRILQGGHYFSDVIFSGIFVWLSTYLVFFLVDNIIKKVKPSE